MNGLIIFFLLTLFSSCQSSDKKAAINSAQHLVPSAGDVKQMIDSTSCKKCDKLIIEIATEQWDKLTDKQVEQFLCSFDKKCKLNEKYKYSGGTYEQNAFDMLIVQMDRHLVTCIRLFDTNKNIDFAYILSLLENSLGTDLPWPSIISQLDNMKPLTSTEQKIYDTIKRSEAKNKKKYDNKN